MDSQIELQLRRMIYERLEEIAADRGAVTRGDLEAVAVGGETYKAIDRNAGIWNPAAFTATLSVLSDPDSEYDDTDLGDSLFSYAYEKTSEDGKTRRCARHFSWTCRSFCYAKSTHLRSSQYFRCMSSLTTDQTAASYLHSTIVSGSFRTLYI